MKVAGKSLFLLLFVAAELAAAGTGEEGRWQRTARRVSIVRDDWGIAHIHGPTDADAVFGMIYAQAEDDFLRVETNYLNALGRLAEAEGEEALWSDLRTRLYVNDADLQVRYRTAPRRLKALMRAWADGLNFYLANHPEVKPRVIRRYEPWMALSFTEGSIGGDIERISLKGLASFYGKARIASAQPLWHEPAGSNGFAIAPQNTMNHHALLWINPHTSFYFRAEQQVSSDQGLNAYGAATWGQFFIYQGFNERAGWMHTSSGVDNTDTFLESIVAKDGNYFYRYGAELRPMSVSTVTVPYRTTDGGLARRTFTVYRTHHGPIVGEQDGKWLSYAMMYKPVEALKQSYLRTKTHTYAEFRKVAELKANSSNNTIFADAKGEIAYLHPQFIPKRNDRFDYRKPVDGADPTTDWKGLHKLDEAPHLLNPPNGWITNTNNWPYSAAGAASPRRQDFPRYMDTAGENARGIHAIQVLQERKDFALQALRDAAFDSDLPAFAELIPLLTDAYDKAPVDHPLKAKLAAPIVLLKTWDHRWSAASEATSLAVFWGEGLWAKVLEKATREGQPFVEAIAKDSTPQEKLQALADAVDRLEQDFGNWRTPWGEINRYQRLSADLKQAFADHKPSLPVPFTSGQWGSLASFGARRYPGTKRYYGTSGNSFLAAVEFGDRVKAFAVTAGGESGHPTSKHFDDQAARYISGDLRPVYFYADELKGHVERSYHPGQ